MAVSAIFNIFEAALWFAISAVLFWQYVRRGKSAGPDDLLLLALAFAMFGASDVVGVQSGAWWRPWWLFLMKVSCVLVFLFAFVRYRRSQKRH